MKLLRHAVAGLVLFGLLMVIYVNVYNSTAETYGFEDNISRKSVTINGTTVNGTIAEQFERLNLKRGVESINENLNKIKTPTGSEFDQQTGITLGAIDVLKVGAGLVVGAGTVIIGIATAPFEIINILNIYYGSVFPQYIGTYLALIVVCYVAFILLSRYMKEDI